MVAGQVELRVAWWGSQDRHDRTIKAIELFQKKYPNIKVGTEGTTYYLRQFYKLQNTPFTALYNRQGKLIGSYRKKTPLNEIAKLVKSS